MIIVSNQVSGVSPDFDLTRIGYTVRVDFYYGLSGFFDEEAGFYRFNGDASSSIGRFSGSASQGDDAPLLFSYVAQFTPGAIYNGSYQFNDYDDGTSVSFAFKIVLFTTTASFQGTSSVDVVFGSPGSDLLRGAAGNDFFEAGAGNDTIDGGLGADRMAGGAGNDIYVVNSTGDVVDESPALSSGADTVQSSITFNLASASVVKGQVENAVLLGVQNLNAIGNSLNNVLTGNTAGNALSGGTGNDTIRGHLGNDTLTGGANNDSFTFNTAPDYSTNRDVVTDFTHGVDKFWMENAIFTKLGAAGVLLNPAFLRVGAAAVDANDFIVYNKATGGLFYDSNANAVGGLLAVAVLINKPLLSASDFAVI
jgi:Ca2+-binding RTX toxin-like protein